MLIIRLQRKGKKNEPTFRVILTDSKNGPKSGNFIEILGSYDPRDKNITKINKEKVLEWIAKGAQVSDTVHNILINQGIIEGKKINVLPKKSPIIDEEAIAKAKEEEEAKAAALKEEAEKQAEAPAEEVVEGVKEEVVETATEAPAAEIKEEVAEEVKEEVAETPAEEVKIEEAPAEESKEEVK